MAEAVKESAAAVAAVATGDAGTALNVLIQKSDFTFHVSTDSKCIGATLIGAALTALYFGRDVIVREIKKRVFGGGGSHLVIDCPTAESFLDFLQDYKSGKLKKDLKEKLLKEGNEVEELGIKIENEKEAEEHKNKLKKELIKTNMELGRVYFGDAAIQYYEKAKEIAQELGDKRQEREAYREMGYAYRKLGQHKTSNEYFQKASEISLPQGQRKFLWRKTSKMHRDKFEKLVNDLETEPEKAIKIGTYSVCLNSDFVIGQGSDGTTVYIGLCDDGMEVAVKELLLDRCKHLGSNEKEILISPTIRKEQYIVNYLFYTDNVNSKNAYLVLDLCEESLKDYVVSAENSRAMLESKGVNFLRQILLGLKALHCGDPEILHRDLKPSNIFVNVEGELVLADFGISRKLKEGQTTYKSVERGTPGWIAVESISTEEDGDCLSREEEKVRYKKQSDIQVAGMVLFYILTKGKHPYGNSNSRRHHLSEGNPVNLNKVSDPLAKDLIEWMLQHDLRERPDVEECLKHPYLMSTDEMFHFVTRVGNELEMKTKDVNSVVVKQLNADPSLPKPSWKPKIDTEVISYVSGHGVYSDDVADLLRFIRNTAEHWRDKIPPTTVQVKVGSPKEYFLNLFPTLPVVLHRIIRKNPDWKQREKLKQFF